MPISKPTSSLLGPVILHASDDAEDVQRGLRLCKQIVNDPQCSDNVMLVVNHRAIIALEDITNAEIPDGVSVYACATAMKTHHISHDSVASQIRIVPSGVVFLAQQQHTGAWYIRL